MKLFKEADFKMWGLPPWGGVKEHCGGGGGAVHQAYFIYFFIIIIIIKQEHAI